MAKPKILYIANEINPFTKQSEIAKEVKKIAKEAVKQGFEARVIVPRFGTINQRVNSVHEVLRLSGVNITLGNEQYSLLVKIASIRDAKLQVYFIDNEELFDRKGKIYDKNGRFYEDNDTRALFFCKAALSTVRRQEWAPDIVHCHGWFSSLIPLYLKTNYKTSLSFKDAKCIYTVYQDEFEGTLHKENFFEKAKLPETYLLHFQKTAANPNYHNLIKLASSYSDLTTHSFISKKPTIVNLLQEINSQKVDHELHIKETYIPMYNKLLQK